MVNRQASATSDWHVGRKAKCGDKHGYRSLKSKNLDILQQLERLKIQTPMFVGQQERKKKFVACIFVSNERSQ